MMRRRLVHFWNRILIQLQFALARLVHGNSILKYVDIGASAIKKPQMGGAFENLEVTAFDPDPRAQLDFENLGFNVDFYPYGVAGTNGIRTLYLTQKSHCSSLLKPLESDDVRYKVERELEVDCRTLDSLDINADIIKIDVQGAELEILKEATTTVSGAHVVELEVWFERKYHDQARIDELQEFMTKYGYKSAGFSSLYFNSADRQSSVGFGDMVFVRPGQSAHGYKVMLAALIDASLDHLIAHFVSPGLSRLSDRWIVAFIILLGMFKFKSPRIY